MKPAMKASCLLLPALLLALAGCERGRHEQVAGVIQTRFPGQVTAGGGTSGQVLARSAKPVTEGSYAGGTPGIAGGSGGTTGGAATAGSVQESGQGPSRGTSQPSSMGRPGTTLPPGDMGKPAGPPPAAGAGPAVQRDNPAPAAPAH
jgi:hypothetical protein